MWHVCTTTLFSPVCAHTCASVFASARVHSAACACTHPVRNMCVSITAYLDSQTMTSVSMFFRNFFSSSEPLPKFTKVFGFCIPQLPLTIASLYVCHPVMFGLVGTRHCIHIACISSDAKTYLSLNLHTPQSTTDTPPSSPPQFPQTNGAASGLRPFPSNAHKHVHVHVCSHVICTFSLRPAATHCSFGTEMNG